MELFWRQGYTATPLDQLVRHTGASRYGLYATFGGKRDLFLTSLERYSQAVMDPMLQPAVRRDRPARIDLSGITALEILRRGRRRRQLPPGSQSSPGRATGALEADPRPRAGNRRQAVRAAAAWRQDDAGRRAISE